MTKSNIFQIFRKVGYTDYSPFTASISIYLLSSAVQLFSPKIEGRFLTIVPNSLIAAISSYLILTLVKKYYDRTALKSLAFLAAATLVGLNLSFILFFLVGMPPSSTALNSRAFLIFTLLRTLVAAFIVLGITGFTNMKMNMKNIELESAISVIKEMDSKYVLENEFFRDGIAHFLHDVVQSKLYLIGLKLRDFSVQNGSNDDTFLSEIISEIDEIRRVNLRSIAHMLSPNIKSTGMASALEELSLRYIQVTSFSFQIDENLKEALLNNDFELGIAIYRLVESALNNAVIHGAASEVEISVQCREEKEIVISVMNNGENISADWADLKVESTTVSHWIRKFNGSFSLVNVPGGGVRFDATLIV